MKRIWVNGCFDILHIGHLNLLKFSKSLGTYLRVGVDSDRRVKEFKGNDRPLHDENLRADMLQELQCVDDTVIFDSDEELIEQIKIYKPHIIIVGDDYRFKNVIGEEYAEEAVVFFKKLEGHSASEIIEKMFND